MNNNSRPSKREIDKRLKEAKEALQNHRVGFANPSKIVGELMALEIGDAEEVWPLILDLIEELELENYEGKHPPEKSYEPTIAGCELWAFSWYSALLKKTMYLKFAIREDSFFYVSLHKSKFSKDEKNELLEVQQQYFP